MPVLEQLEDAGLELSISDDDKGVLNQLNYQDINALLSGTANKERMLKQPRLPDEKATDEEKAKFAVHLNKYLGVPETVDGYKIERPKEMPEGMAYDEDFEREVVKLAYAKKIPSALINDLANFYNSWQIKNYTDYKKKVQNDIAEFIRDECAGSKERFTEIVGDPDQKITGKTTKALLMLSAVCGLDYKDQQGKPQSRLIDCLELHRNGVGALGDKLPLVKVLAYIYDNFLAEGKTAAGEALMQTAGPGEGRKEPYSEMK